MRLTRAARRAVIRNRAFPSAVIPMRHHRMFHSRLTGRLPALPAIYINEGVIIDR